MNDKLLQYLLLINSLLFLLMMPVIGSFYRYVPEDYVAITGIQENGVLPFSWQCVQTWGGRFIPYFFSFTLIYLHEIGVSFFWYYLLFFSLFTISVIILIQNISRSLALKINALERFNISTWIILLIFYSSVGFSESYFWTTASTSYFIQIVFLFCGLSLISIYSIRWYFIIGIYLLFFYVGNASEPFALLSGLFLLLILFYQWATKINYRFRLKTFLALIATCSGFAFTMMLQGTWNRLGAMPDVSFSLFLKRNLTATAEYIIIASPLQLIYILPFSFLFLFLGLHLKKEISSKYKMQSIKVWIRVTLIYLFIVFLSFMPSCWIMGEAGPLRSWHHIAIYTTISIVIVTFYTGMNYRGVILNGRIFLYLYIVFCIGLSAVIFFKQYQKANSYSLACDQRIALLKALEQRDFKGLIILQPLPDPGFLYKQELSNYKENYVNVFLKENLKLSFDVAVNVPR